MKDRLAIDTTKGDWGSWHRLQKQSRVRVRSVIARPPRRLPMPPKKTAVNVFHQRLGTLTYHQAIDLLGDEGPSLLRTDGQTFEIQSDRDVFLGGDMFRVRVEDGKLDGGLAIATITLQSGRDKQLLLNCNQCEIPCHHLGAALEYLLDGKTVLGLAMPPDETVPL